MTITLYLNKINLLRDLQTLQAIFDAGTPKLVEPLRGFLHSLDISLEPFTRNNTIIQVTPEEFTLIRVFNGDI
jgi:hypothetical protein